MNDKHPNGQAKNSSQPVSATTIVRTEGLAVRSTEPALGKSHRAPQGTGVYPATPTAESGDTGEKSRSK